MLFLCVRFYSIVFMCNVSECVGVFKNFIEGENNIFNKMGVTRRVIK